MARDARTSSRLHSLRSRLSPLVGLSRRLVRLRLPRPLRPVLRPRPYRAATATTPLAHAHAPNPYWRALAVLAVTLLGAWLGLLAAGSIRTPVGPMDTTMTLRPSLTGGAKINVAPLGALELRTYHAPLRLDVDVDQLNQRRAAELVDHPDRIAGLQGEITADVASGTRDLAVRSAVAAVAGACALGLLVYWRPRPALAAGGLSLTLLAASGATAYATWNPDSVLEPRFSGLLASAPSVVGNARSIVSDFGVYQRELARLVTNVTKLYETASTLPAYQPDPSTIRVLHVSDIHLNPAAWQIVKSLVEQYGIDVIVDSGDTMDHGTSAENGFLDPVRKLGAPYVWVRGNHDSHATQSAFDKLARQNGGSVHVLDRGRPLNVAGLRFAGWGDPQFTPDRSIVRAGDPEERRDGRRLTRSLRKQRAAGTPVDIAVGHNPVLVQETDGRVPLALAGHTHHRSNTVLPRGTRLMIEGSTGGGGLRAVEDEEPQKVSASVLYLDRDKHKLQAWDELTLGGLGLTTAEVTRHLPADIKRGSGKSPSPSGPATSAPATPPPAASPPATSSSSSSAPPPLSPSPSAPLSPPGPPAVSPSPLPPPVSGPPAAGPPAPAASANSP
jgi:predicted MPP superfamily phosphohydrolase